jgi:hypothetical protein
MPTVLPPLRVFISGTYIDLVDHRTVLIDTIQCMDECPQEMRFFGAQATGDATDASLDEIDYQRSQYATDHDNTMPFVSMPNSQPGILAT